MPLDVLNDVLLEDLAFEALERALQALAFVNLNFSQREVTSVSNQIRLFKRSSFVCYEQPWPF